MIIDSACAEENFFFLADVWVIFLLQHDLHNEKKNCHENKSIPSFSLSNPR